MKLLHTDWYTDELDMLFPFLRAVNHNNNLFATGWFNIMEYVVYPPHLCVDSSKAQGVANGSKPTTDLKQEKVIKVQRRLPHQFQ